MRPNRALQADAVLAGARNRAAERHVVRHTRREAALGRKVLQDIANTLPQMAAGWRMYEDLERFADMAKVRVTIDVLNGTARLESGESVHLQLVSELSGWLAKRLVGAKIPPGVVSAASLLLEVRSDRVPTDHQRIVLFDFECHCSLTTADRTYEGALHDKHHWHQRVGV